MGMIHLDANATSKLRNSARAALTSLLNREEEFRSASSVYWTGRNAKTALAKARRDLIYFLFGDSKADVNLFFTSGGTESCNSLVHGFISDCSPQHIVTTSIEHAAMLAPIAALERRGWRVTRVQPRSDGRIAPPDIVASLRDDTALLAVMAANNETGALQTDSRHIS